jgi:outer membrane biosynthesis protein TonB
MLKNTLFVLLSTLVLSGVCFAQANPGKEQMKETTPAVTQEQPAKEQMKETTPAAAQEQPAKEQMKETTPAAAQKQPALVLEEIHICTGVENREPTGVGTVFSDDLGKIYCFTKIGGAEGTASVYHVWYFGDKEIARVKLPVKAKSWRTWSSKTLNMGLGNGHVEIVSESGAILGKAEFELQAAQKPEKVEKTEKTGVSEKALEAPKVQKEAPKEQKEAPKGQ